MPEEIKTDNWKSGATKTADKKGIKVNISEMPGRSFMISVDGMCSMNEMVSNMNEVFIIAEIITPKPSN